MDLPEKRYKGLNKPFLLDKVDAEKLFSSSADVCNIFTDLIILQRIGSNSLYATVWLARLRKDESDITLAIKIQTDDEKTQKETEISYHFRNWSNYFLVMYGDMYCKDIRVAAETKPHTGTFMFMEVAASDLRQLIRYQNVPLKDLIQYILNVCDSIEIMSSNFLYHGDLHDGNVFIVERDGIWKAVVGDFGESFYDLSPTTHLSDVSKFMSSLIETLSSRNNLGTTWPKLKFKNVQTFINRQTSKTEKEYDLFIENSPDFSDELGEEKIKELVKNDMEDIRNMLIDIMNDF